MKFSFTVYTGVIIMIFQCKMTNELFPLARIFSSLSGNSNATTFSGPTRCYGEYGCITNDRRFYSALRPINLFPLTPARMKVEFLLYTRDNPEGPQVITPTVERIRSSNYRIGLPLKIIVHGFIAHTELAWAGKLVNEILRVEDVNVILVDWRFGAYHFYTQVTANTRLLSAMIIKFVSFLQESFSLLPEDIHFIGHSLGAHAAGYVGEKIKGIGRITGLDPAGPYFDGTHHDVRLDPTDALFVDVIHFNGIPITSGGFGYGPPCGHVDFYPNGGAHQPECSKSLLRKFRSSEDFEMFFFLVVGCNHNQAFDFYIETFKLGSCPFTAVQCSSYSEFSKGECFNCGSEGEKCAPVGYFSEQWFHKFKSNVTLPVKMYLKTGTARPLCRYHHRVTLKTSDNPSRNGALGKFALKFTDSDGFTSYIHPFKRELKFSPSSTFNFVIASKSPEFLKQVELHWLPTNERTTNGVEISIMEIEGLEISYRCIYDVNPHFFTRNSFKTFTSERCETVSSENNKIVHYPLPNNASTRSDRSSLNKTNSLIPQPLFTKRTQALSYILDPLIENLFTRRS